MKQDVRKQIFVYGYMNFGFVRQVVDRVDYWWVEFIRGGDASNEDAAVGSYKDETGQTPDASEKANCQLTIGRHRLIGKTSFNIKSI